jgi:hypothetical protein
VISDHGVKVPWVLDIGRRAPKIHLYSRVYKEEHISLFFLSLRIISTPSTTILNSSHPLFLKMSKTILVVGATGIQGSSVASTFLQIPNWIVRGLVRDPTSPNAIELATKGVELVKGDLADPASLAAAVKGVNVIFANTRFNPAQAFESAEFKALAKPGQSPLEFHFEEEVAKGRNIADAAAAVEGLERFVWSSASEPGKWSKGKYDDLLSFETKGAVWKYIQDTYPELARKTSLLYLGSYATNWQWGQASYNWIKVRVL